METKSKYDELIELANKLFIYTDHQQWEKLLSEVFTKEIIFDMSSLGAGDARKLKATEVCDMWKIGFAGIDAVHLSPEIFSSTFNLPTTLKSIVMRSLSISKNLRRKATHVNSLGATIFMRYSPTSDGDSMDSATM